MPRPTNKAERRDIEKNKFKQRILKYHGVKFFEKGHDVFKETKSYCFKSTGKPCSCFMCSGEKYKRTFYKINDEE